MSRPAGRDAARLNQPGATACAACVAPAAHGTTDHAFGRTCLPEATFRRAGPGAALSTE